MALTERGHVLNACQFDKAMNEVQVETTIMEVFGETIPRLVDIEILMSVHNKLVKPTLAPGQEGITGVILHRLFKNKPIYVRPGGGTPRNSWWGCAARVFKSRPYFRPKHAIFHTRFQT